ncbi:MAG: hypothetical protein BV457_05720 [Thermoplasmata archaeon M9B1D]|nr:MAG: hypothetical protein BV457_05720 [Thermoplasmata archaeon M9B1D]
MKYKTIFTFLVILLFINCIIGISNGLKIKKIDEKTNTTFLYPDENDADLPIWNIGDSWTYYLDMSGGYESNLIELTFHDITFIVEEVQAEFYKMGVSATFTGYASLRVPFLPIPISGSINNGHISGLTYVSKNNLLLSTIDNIQFSGKIGNINFDGDGKIVVTYGKPGALVFPLNVGGMWNPDLTLIEPGLNLNIFGLNLDLASLLQSTYGTDYISIWAHTVEVDSWDLVEIGSFDYDAIKIVSPDLGEKKHIYWYAPSVGNILKVESRGIHLFGEPEGYFGRYDIDVELKHTTYDIKTNPPTKPFDFTGDSQILVGIEAFYTATAIDPDGDMVRYICNWGDGTISASEKFYNSGQTGEITHTWTKKGEYNVTVKARDKSGAESSWSDSFTVIVTNNSPDKPDKPDGPTQGKIRTEVYTYTTSTFDVDGHNLYYQFDWGDGSTSGWTGPYISGDTASASHMWTKRGSYNIKVKARDEYGEESEWSDPLPISMAKYKLLATSYSILIEKIEFPYQVYQVFTWLLNRLFY